MSELKIPEAAIEAVVMARVKEDAITDMLRAAAPLIVAAELRRLAKEQLKTHDDISCMSLLRRADELDPQSVTK